MARCVSMSWHLQVYPKNGVFLPTCEKSEISWQQMQLSYLHWNSTKKDTKTTMTGNFILWYISEIPPADVFFQTYTRLCYLQCLADQFHTHVNHSGMSGVLSWIHSIKIWKNTNKLLLILVWNNTNSINCFMSENIIGLDWFFFLLLIHP